MRGASTGGVCGASSFDSANEGWRRLSALQIENTLLDLSAAVLGDINRNTIRESLALLLSELTKGDTEYALSQAGENAGAAFVGLTFDLAMAVSRIWTKPEQQSRLLRLCDGVVLATDCVGRVIDHVVPLAFRRPISTGERQALMAIHSDTAGVNPDQLWELFTVILTSPEFLYRMEHGTGPALVPDVYALDGFEIASRISYYATDSMPDETLRRLAQDGVLADAEQRKEQLSRLMDDAQGRAKVTSFFDAWLQFSTAADPAEVPLWARKLLLRPGIAADDAGWPELRTAARFESLTLANLHLWNDQSLDDLMTTNLNVTSHPLLAQLYGVSTADADNPGVFDNGDRPGLFTRAATLFQRGSRTNPGKRGFRIRNTLLCEDVPPHPIAFPAPSYPSTGAPVGSRSMTELEVGSPTCLSCHNFFDGIGFIFEGYDNLAQRRQVEKVITEDAGLRAELAINAVAAPQVPIGDDTTVGDPLGLMKHMFMSGAVDACFAKRVLEHAMERTASDEDACTLSTLVESGDVSMRQVFVDMVQSGSFLQRSFR